MNQPNLQLQLEEQLKNIKSLSATNLCVRCGLCIDSCHVYTSTGDPETNPVAKAEKIRRIRRRNNSWLKKAFQRRDRPGTGNAADLQKWVDLAYRDCSLCERCVINCPLAVETPQLISMTRKILSSLGLGPETLVQLADMEIIKGENIEALRKSHQESVMELEKKVQDEMGSSKARIPFEKKAARILYVPISGEHTIIPQAIIFNIVGESWTMSVFEASNYAFFLGDEAKSKQIAGRILQEAERLDVGEIVITGCGHAYQALRWEAPKWFNGRFPFPVRSIVEILDEYLREGRLRPNPSKNSEAITYHDSCNLGRKGGLFAEPRRVIKAIAEDFREMRPNGIDNYCCGGGGGLIAIPEWRDFRLIAGKPKADQIKATGAEVVVTSCANCRQQIRDLSEHYNLSISVTSLSELMVNAISD